MIPAALHHILEAIDELKKLQSGREVSLAITKLEEAKHWYTAAMNGVPKMPSETKQAEPLTTNPYQN